MGPVTGADGDELRSLRRDHDTPVWRRLLEVPVLLGVAALIAIVVKAFLAQAFFIPSASMEPQLTAGDRVVVSRMAYDLHEPRRGDIVVFDDPSEPPSPDDRFIVVRIGSDALEALGLVKPPTKELIKRVVALPDETVESRGGQVYVDNRRLIEPYLDDHVITSDFGPYVVPEDHVFVLGDNRANSQDSRRFDGVARDRIVGRAIARVWPPGRVAFL